MDYAAARHNMVENQVKPNRVLDRRIIDAMESVPREVFVPKHLRGIAYVDEDLEISRGRYLIEPMVLARLLEFAEFQPGDVVLDIGGAGYSSAVIAQMASTVVSLECDADLARHGAQVLSELGVDNAAFVEGPLNEGYPGQAPYDVIIVQGAVSEIPQALCSQLADGGRLLAVVQAGERERMGNAIMVTRFGNTFGRRTLFEAGVPMLPGFQPKPQFVF